MRSTGARTRLTSAAMLVLAALGLAGCITVPPQGSPEPQGSGPPGSEPRPTESVEPSVPSASSSGDVEPANEHDVAELTMIPWSQLQPGHCIAGLGSQPRHVDMQVVPCADQHNAELLIVSETPSTEYPGDEALAAEADAWCGDLLPALLHGIPDDMMFGTLYPSEATWAEGDRSRLCFAVAYDAYFTGSFIGGSGEVHTT